MNNVSHWCAAAALAVTATSAHAFPDKPITVIVPFGAGSAVDIHARDFAQALSGVIKQTVVVDNRAGAEGSIGARATLSADPDGHTLMFTSSSLPVLDPVLKKKTIFDPINDFKPICTVGKTSNVMNITGSSDLKTAADVIAKAKADPGKVTFAYASATTRLAGELFQQATGTKFTGVPYKASTNAMTEVAGGQVDLMFIDNISAGPYYGQNKLRPLAVAGATRINALPDTPSAVEIGAPGYDILPWFGVYVSAQTPDKRVDQLREAMALAMKTPIAAENINKRGLTPYVVCGKDMADLQNKEIAFWKDLVQKAGIEPQ